MKNMKLTEKEIQIIEKNKDKIPASLFTSWNNRLKQGHWINENWGYFATNYKKCLKH